LLNGQANIKEKDTQVKQETNIPSLDKNKGRKKNRSEVLELNSV
jgi:hypothetical protein